nr:hypothetical protein [Streptomyces chartreusis]
MTATLNARRDDVPEELKSSVDSLTGMLRAVAAPETTPQDRGAVTESAEALASTLGVIADAVTPGGVRDQLTRLVKQVTAALEAGQEPDVPAEDRSRLFMVSTRTTSALDMIADTDTPQKVRKQLATIVEDLNYAMEHTNGIGETGRTGVTLSASIVYLVDSARPQDGTGSNMTGQQESGSGNQRELLNRSEQTGREMRRASDPDSSQEEQSEARGEMRRQTARMKDEQRKAAAEQESTNAPLGDAAEGCANAIFKIVSERRLSNGLKDLTPQSWDSVGVKDFWKASSDEKSMLDIRAFLRNDQNTHAPFVVADLIVSFADFVRVDELNTDIGGRSAAHCKQSAQYLEDRGVIVGDWGDSDDSE